MIDKSFLTGADRDCVLAKVSSIRKCLKSIQLSTNGNPDSVLDWQKQDVVVLNLQRAIQGCIDICQVVLAAFRLELPRSYKHGFAILAQSKILSDETASLMVSLCGFRNIAVHDYQELNLEILKAILREHLTDFEKFTDEIFVLVAES